MLLKDLLRGRGILLIEDRTDIVGAAEADGVVLSRQGDTFLACCEAYRRDKNRIAPLPDEAVMQDTMQSLACLGGIDACWSSLLAMDGPAYVSSDGLFPLRAPGCMSTRAEMTCSCSSGLPTVVARRSLPDAANLVGRRVASGQEAQQAASDGASLLLVEVRRTPQEILPRPTEALF